jgi:hypothetical protein
MVWKATIVFIASGLTGSGIVALSRSTDESASPASSPPISQADAPLAITPTTFDPSNPAFQNEPLQRGYIQANVAAQRPFATFNRVSR